MPRQATQAPKSKSNGNGKSNGHNLITNQERDDLLVSIQNISTLVSRAALAAQFGQSFGGLRDTFEVFGYPKKITFQEFLGMYEREGLAARATDGTANESWRKRPILWDGEVEGQRGRGVDMKKQTEFLRAFDALDKRLHLFSALNQADRILGYSRYAVIFLGAPGRMSQPLTSGKIKYIEVLDEGEAMVANKETSRQNARFGLPISYNITFSEQQTAEAVHFSRVIHIREGKERNSRYFGVPRLQKSYNYFLDLHKVMGGSSEAFWLLVRKGLALIGREGVDMPQKGTDAYNDLKEEIEEYEHGLRRFMRLRGMDIQDLGGQVVDGGGQVELLTSAVAGTNEIPQRIMMGSERGQLASQQDDANWADVIAARQTDHCGPMMLEPLVNRFIEIGALPKPSNDWTYEFPSLFELTPLEKADLAGKEVTAINSIAGGAPESVVDIEAFIKKNFPAYVMTPAKIAAQAERMRKIRGQDQEGEGFEEDEEEPTFSKNDDDLYVLDEESGTLFRHGGKGSGRAFDESRVRRHPKGSDRGGEFAPKGGGRVWSGTQAKGKNKVSKLEAGERGEKVAAKVLEEEIGAKFETVNVGVNNAPIDLAGDHMAVEVKTGMATNGPTAHHWRATIGQPGREETALLKIMSAEDKRKWNIRKSQLILTRKKNMLQRMSREVGGKVKPMTVGVILSPNGKKADVFFIPGFHLRLPWNQYATDDYYMGTYDV